MYLNNYIRTPSTAKLLARLVPAPASAPPRASAGVHQDSVSVESETAKSDLAGATPSSERRVFVLNYRAPADTGAKQRTLKKKSEKLNNFNLMHRPNTQTHEATAATAAHCRLAIAKSRQKTCRAGFRLPKSISWCEAGFICTFSSEKSLL